jgi:hypothetical protein
MPLAHQELQTLVAVAVAVASLAHTGLVVLVDLELLFFATQHHQNPMESSLLQLEDKYQL